MKPIKLKIKDITRDITLNIEIVGYEGWIVRLWIMKALMWLGCRIGGVGVKFEREENGH